MNNKLILVHGLSGAGKDTLSKYVCKHYPYKKLAFAGKLKDAVSVIFGWDREWLNGETNESRLWRTQIDEEWSDLLGFEFTPRYVLQHIGTESLRTGFHDAIWSATVLNEIIQKSYNKIIISDWRFLNEYIYLKNRFNGKIYTINVIRNSETEANIHSSESGIDMKFDYTVDNSYSLTYLYRQTREIMEEIDGTW